MSEPNTVDEDASDPLRVVRRVVDELKAQGTFDLIRAECLADVDTKPAYQNVRSRVESCVSRFLAKQEDAWKPTTNKSQLRNQLRQYIQESTYMATGLERSVEQSVNPRVELRIRPAIESILFKYLGIDEESDEQHPHAGELPNGEDELQSEKEQSNTSRGVDMEDGSKVKMSEGSPSLKGNISPLTPRKSVNDSDNSNSSSPKTPPPPPMPPLPPLPPPFIPPLPPEGEAFPMSPMQVDDDEPETPPPAPPGESEDDQNQSPPPPPGLEDEMAPKHEVEHDKERPTSQSENETKSVGSDGELAELERTRAALQAKLAAATLGSSEEATTTSEEATASEVDEGKTAQEESKEKQQTSTAQEKHVKKKETCERPLEVPNVKGGDDDDDDDKDDINKIKKYVTSSSQGSKHREHRKGDNVHSQSTESVGAPDEKSESSGRSQDTRRHHHKRRHSGHEHEGHKKRRHNSSASKKTPSESDTDQGRATKRDSGSGHQSKDKKEREKLKMKRSKEQLERIEQKIKEKSNLKSSKFKDFDMFAPKPPKPKYLPPSSNRFTPDPVDNLGKLSQVQSRPIVSSTRISECSKDLNYKSSLKQEDHTAKSSRLAVKPKVAKEASNRGFDALEPLDDTIRAPRKVFPELPVSKSTGDKLKQHEDDIAAAKARLEQARARKIIELKTKELEKKRLRRSNSSSLEEASDSESSRGRKRSLALDYSDASPLPCPSPKKTKRKRKLSEEKPVGLKLHQRKKLNLADLEDSDEDEVSDWEGDANISGLNAQLKKTNTESDEGNGHGLKIHTRQSKIRELIDAQLQSDPKTPLKTQLTMNGCEDSSIQLLRKSLEEMENNGDVYASSFSIKDEMSNDGFIYIDPSCSSVTPKELVTHLKYHYGGSPTLVPKMPQWLVLILQKWHLLPHHVNVSIEKTVFGNVASKIYKEKEYNELIGRRFNEKIETSSMTDESRFRGFKVDVIEDASNHFEELDNAFGFTSYVQKEGNTFGMDGYLDVALEDSKKKDDFDLIKVDIAWDNDVTVVNDTDEGDQPTPKSLPFPAEGISSKLHFDKNSNTASAIIANNGDSR